MRASGQNEAARKSKNGHRKGHTVKGFKTTYHKDEDGKDEKYFDEANDAGESFSADGKSGSFGEKEEAAFKGAQENTELSGNKASQQKQYETQQSTEKSESSKDQYGSSKFGGDNAEFKSNNGGQEESQSGYKQENKFSKQ